MGHPRRTRLVCHPTGGLNRRLSVKERLTLLSSTAQSRCNAESARSVATAETWAAGCALMELLRLRHWRGLRRLLAPLADAVRLILRGRRSHKLLARPSQLGLRIGQLLPGGLQLAVHLSQVSVPRGHVLGQLGQVLLRLRPLLLNLPDLSPALIAAGGQGRYSPLTLSSLPS